MNNKINESTCFYQKAIKIENLIFRDINNIQYTLCTIIIIKTHIK